MNTRINLKGVEVTAPILPEFEEILTNEALDFVAGLARKFSATRDALLQKRVERQQAIDSGKLPDFLPETASIRQGDWKIAPVPEDLQDRRVEITGLPATAKW